ncbi:MAG: RdgB/HAM1 family non-canonical purine NTP pyrophosphatase [Coriobacteriales bacterium]|jgi:XTP/dITP diphosphohydrolase|nr:RdgB/HAM1 family non-canonical purine NTP pyrophosphatase [Coriobacteriales bacterium]
MKTVVVATQNEHKASEIAQILAIDGWEFVPLAHLGILDAPCEDASTFEGNARIKAQAAHRRTGHAALADDSGLVVDALDGAPGIHSARYASDADGTSDANDGNDAANNIKLLAALEGIPLQQRTARFVCVIVFIDEDGSEVVAQGSCEGTIARGPQGDNGFGYDPLFQPAAFFGRCTMATLPPAEKNVISHRALALANLRSKLVGA